MEMTEYDTRYCKVLNAVSGKSKFKIVFFLHYFTTTTSTSNNVYNVTGVAGKGFVFQYVL